MTDPSPSSRKRANGRRAQRMALKLGGIAIFLVYIIIVIPISGFLCNTAMLYCGQSTNMASCQQHQHLLFMGAKDNGNSNNENNDTPKKNNDKEEEENVVIKDLSWRVAKLQLEEANTRRFLKRKPIKLSYTQSQQWIQRNWAPKTKQEFEDLVANGNLRTPYISKRPEEYYGERGEWISWDHYLLGECVVENNNGKNSTDDRLKWQ